MVPGKVQAGDFLVEAERILGESDALLDLAETQQVSGAAFQDKARFCRDTYVIIEYGVSQLAENAKRYSGIEKTAKPRKNGSSRAVTVASCALSERTVCWRLTTNARGSASALR